MTDISLSDLSKILSEASVKIKIEAELAVVTVATEIRDRAKEKIGVYQESSHGFAAWAPLAQSTMDQRVRLGFSENRPLERSGGLRDSIEMRASGNGAIVGTPLDEGLWMEIGTDKAPPRPYLGPAAAEIGEKLGEIFSPHLKRTFRR